jgi:hypothetical protein
MPLGECARRTIRAVWRRQRELVMTPRARVAAVIKAVAPGVVDRAAARSMFGPGDD